MKVGKKGRTHKVALSKVTQAPAKSGLSQSQFAQILGVSLRTLHEWKLTVVLAVLVYVAIGGCVYTPSVVTRYDEQCDIELKKMELTEKQLSLLEDSHCTHAVDCTAVVAVQVLAAPVSAVVSGSIVLVGNTIFWMQKQGQCQSVAMADSE